MPINCPLPFGEIMICGECRYCSKGKCWWFLPALDLTEILTVQERLVAVEKWTQSFEKPQPGADRPHDKPKPKLAGGVRL